MPVRQQLGMSYASHPLQARPTIRKVIRYTLIGYSPDMIYLEINLCDRRIPFVGCTEAFTDVQCAQLPRF